MTWIKRILFLALVFFGLYFFGDFNINGTNVRDKLQSWIPPETLMVWKEKVVGTVEDTFSDNSLNSKKKIQPKNKTLEQIPEKDQKKFENLMKDLTKD